MLASTRFGREAAGFLLGGVAETGMKCHKYGPNPIASGGGELRHRVMEHQSRVRDVVWLGAFAPEIESVKRLGLQGEKRFSFLDLQPCQ